MSRRTIIFLAFFAGSGLVQGLFQIGDPVQRDVVTPGRVIFVVAFGLGAVLGGYFLGRLDERESGR